MNEVPTGDFRYIYENGGLSTVIPHSRYNKDCPNAIKWTNESLTATEIFTPGWCEYKNKKGNKEVWWRYADGLVNSTHPPESLPVNCHHKFIRQLTFESEEEK